MTDDPGEFGAETSTIPGGDSGRRAARGRWLRGAFFALIVAFLAIGMAGLLGVRSADVSASGGGYEIKLTYARVSRPGLDTPWSVEIRHRGGFPVGLVTIATTASYFDILETSGIQPEPVESISDGKRLIWSFQPPPSGETLTVSLEGRVGSGVELERARGTTAVLAEGSPVVSVTYRTFVAP